MAKSGVLDKPLYYVTMKDSVIVKNLYTSQEPGRNENLEQRFQEISQKLDTEIAAKQRTIERLEFELREIKTATEEKNNQIKQLNEKLADCMYNAEGNKQLISKLLNDIDRLNLDIEWYRRTYEKRSLLGTIREKLFRK